MKKRITIMFVCLLQVLWAIASTYNLKVEANPEDACSLYTDGGTYEEGRQVYLSTYGNTGFVFKGWYEGDTQLSTSTSFYYKMPSKDVVVQARYEYDPTVPADPDAMAPRYKVDVKCKPDNSGSFNTWSVTETEGSSIRLYAYTNEGFRFQHWEDGKGNVISSSQKFNYTIPHGNSVVYGVFEYDPEVPSNPAKNFWNATLGEVIIDDFTPGSLSRTIYTTIGDYYYDDVKMITVSGIMDNNDFGIVNNYSDCSLLDLSRVTGITAIPDYAFDYTNLETVYLPSTIESIGSKAFYNCDKLSALTMYAMVPPTVGKYAFSGIPEGVVVYVPAASISQYQEADVWKEFSILPIQEDIRNVTISLPIGTDASVYAQMWLELTNRKSGQKIHYVMTDRTSYTFANIIRNTSWNAVVRNQRGDVFGRIEGIDVGDEDVTMVFESLKKPQNVSLTIKDSEGKDVTAEAQITWTDADGNYLAQASSINGLITGYKVAYKVALSQDLALLYSTPAQTEYYVGESSNKITCKLTALQKIVITGKVTDDITKSAMSDVVVSASQTFGGKYDKTVNAKTDSKGRYTLELLRVPTSLFYAASGYVNQTMECDLLSLEGENASMPEVSMKSITGAVVNIEFTYKKCPESEGAETKAESFYNDYDNVSYSIYNKTQGRDISLYSVQYPMIVLLENVNESDVLEITATSRTSAFMPVKSNATIDAEQRAKATFNIVELGKLKSTFAANANASVVGSLYDSTGKLLKTGTYSGGTLTVNDLTDGYYTLVTMGSSSLFNTIYDLNQLSQTSLTKDVDYVMNNVKIESGKLSVISIAEVPTIDESKLYYTGDNTSFTVNKTSIVAGNYLTLTGHLNFKPAYSTKISNVNLIVDLPEACSFVENSVMVGNATSTYTLEGNRITIPLARYTDRVRFCIIPTLGGDYAPSALAQFDIDGETITQPIGSASYNAKDLSITAPSRTTSSTISISGTAIGTCDIEIYDGDILIGQTKSLKDGNWSTMVNLDKPYNLSNHFISAKATTQNGMVLQSETAKVKFDRDAVEISTVHMVYDNPYYNKTYTVTFDFKHASNTEESYPFNPQNKKFTFLINFTDNDPSIVSDVTLYVKTAKSGYHALPASYDSKRMTWVAVGLFGVSNSGDLPVNVAISYNSEEPINIDSDMVNDALSSIDAEGFRKELIELDNLFKSLEKSDLGFDETYDIIFKDFDDIVSDDTDYSSYSDEEMEKLFQECIDNILSYDYSAYDAPTHAKDPETFKIGDDIYTCKQANNFTKEELAAKGFVKIPTSNGDFIYYYCDETKVVCVDYQSNIYASIELSATTANAKMSRLSMREIDDADIWGWTSSLVNGAVLDYAINKTKEEFRTVLKYWKTANRVYIDQTQKGKNKGLIKIWGNTRDYLHKKANGLIKSVKYIEKCKKVAKLFNPARFAYDAWAEWGNAEMLVKLAKEIPQNCTNPIAKNYTNYVFNGIENLNKELWADFAAKSTISTIADNFVTYLGTAYPPSLFITIPLLIGGQYASDMYFEKKFDKSISDIKANIKQINNLCNSNIAIVDLKEYSKSKDKKFIIDPSGYVYEGVSSNRLEGVTATCYYKEMVEDMYGDLHENIVKWDAEEYAQENPLFTDENGMYAWDVPQGLWQVKFEKEGYETTYSEWLPVPPPQLDINIPMTQNVQPNVKSARAFEEAVEMEFDKYMMPEELTAENIRVLVGEKNVEGTIALMNEEVSYEGYTDKYASKLRFIANAPFNAKEVTLMVSNRVKSYAGIRMQDNFSQTFTVEPEVREIVCEPEAMVAYGGKGTLTVEVKPAKASAGKTLSVKTSSPMILSVATEEMTLDSEGKATINIGGELPGAAAITYSIDGYDLTATTMVSVEQINTTPDIPMASVASGSSVLKGTSVTLLCATVGAEIYYTTDGSCPCDNGAKKYDGTPITVSEAMTLKVMAVGKNGEESQIATYQYTIRQTDLQLALAKGWNWVSHNRYNNLDSEELMSDNVKRVLTQDGEMYNDLQFGFTGHIDAISANQAFKVNTSADMNIPLRGDMFNANIAPIALKQGWNWIGYPCDKAMTLTEALATTEAEDGDYIVSIEGGFAQFDGTKWNGTLTTLTPGHGYLFKSASDKNLAYAVNPVATAAAYAKMAYAAQQVELPWHVDVHKYPNVMCVTGELYADGVKAEAGEYVVAAFVDDECRGIGQYVGESIYLSVHGDKKTEVTFLAIDTRSGLVYDIDEKIEFAADAVGSVSLPFVFRLGNTTGIGRTTGERAVVKSIYNTLGQKVQTLDRTGVYIIDGAKVVVTKKNSGK